MRIRSDASAARAAFAPQAPCTPPPGCAEADARNSPRTGVSARPSPGTGGTRAAARTPSCRRPSAPPTRFASRASNAGGGSRCRAVTSERNPGASASISASSRSAKASDSASSQRPVISTGASSPSASPRGCDRHVRVRPHRLGAGRGAGRVGLVHLADEHERARGHETTRELRAVLRRGVHARAHVHGAGAVRVGCPPRDRPRQRPVDLERAVVVLEPVERAHERGREVVLADEVAVERRARRRRRARPRPASTVVPSARVTATARRSRTTTPVTGASQRIVPPRATSRRHERVGEAPRAAFGHGEPVLLSEAGEEPAEEPARRRVDADVAVQRVAREEQRRALAVEALAREPSDRQEAGARELEQPARPERQGELRRAAHRRERRRHGREQVVGDALELAVERRATRRRRRSPTRRAIGRSRRRSGASTAARSPRSGCARASGARRHRSPWASRSSAWSTGEATPSG